MKRCWILALFGRPVMVPRNVFAVIICATLLAWGGRSFAADYRPGDFLNLDLSKAVLSPKRLGPTTEFAPYPIEADTDPAQPAAQARAEPKAVPAAAAARKIRTAHVHVEKRRGAAQPGWRIAIAIRSTPRRSPAGSRSGPAKAAASATGSAASPVHAVLIWTRAA